jgi:hypothetical protein
LYLLTINAVIKQTCITLSDVYTEKKNLEYFIFRQVTDCAALNLLRWGHKKGITMVPDRCIREDFLHAMDNADGWTKI